MVDEKKYAKFKHYAKYITLNILAAAIVSVLLINYVASAYMIKGHSMYSVLYDQDRVIVSKLALKTGKIDRFNILVIKKPHDPGRSIIKRVIGLPEEIIEIRDGEVYINYEKLEQPFLSGKYAEINKSEQMRPLLLGENHYFVMGDNRIMSKDSRSFGPVQSNEVLGKTIFRYWPLSRFGKIE